MGSLGETLRQARLDSGFSLAQVEQETRIRKKYLEALEAEDLPSLPAPVYTRGIARTYARHLGLDPGIIVDFYQARSREEPLYIRSATPRSLESRTLPIKNLAVLASGLAAFVLLAFLWGQYRSVAESVREVERQPADQALPRAVISPAPRATASPVAALGPGAGPAASPIPAPSPTPAPTPIEGVVIEARTTALTWVEAWVDGAKVLAEEVASGQTRSFEGRRSVRMRVSNGATVQIIQNGQPFGALDQSGRPAEALWSRN